MCKVQCAFHFWVCYTKSTSKVKPLWRDSRPFSVSSWMLILSLNNWMWNEAEQLWGLCELLNGTSGAAVERFDLLTKVHLAPPLIPFSFINKVLCKIPERESRTGEWITKRSSILYVLRDSWYLTWIYRGNIVCLCSALTWRSEFKQRQQTLSWHQQLVCVYSQISGRMNNCSMEFLSKCWF